MSNDNHGSRNYPTISESCTYSPSTPSLEFKLVLERMCCNNSLPTRIDHQNSNYPNGAWQLSSHCKREDNCYRYCIKMFMPSKGEIETFVTLEEKLPNVSRRLNGSGTKTQYLMLGLKQRYEL